MAARSGPAQSVYRGLRVTYTQVPGSDTALVTVSGKQIRGKWDEWSLMFPAVRVLDQNPMSAREALDCIRLAVEQMAAELDLSV